MSKDASKRPTSRSLVREVDKLKHKFNNYMLPDLQTSQQSSAQSIVPKSISIISVSCINAEYFKEYDYCW
jgi:hypothetical protein